MTTKAKGKQNDYERVYNAVGKLQDKEPEGLQTTNHERPPEIDDERTIIIEILREQFPRASLNGQEQQDRPTNNEDFSLLSLINSWERYNMYRPYFYCSASTRLQWIQTVCFGDHGLNCLLISSIHHFSPHKFTEEKVELI